MKTAVSVPAQPPMEDIFETIDQMTVADFRVLVERVKAVNDPRLGLLTEEQYDAYDAWVAENDEPLCG